MRLPRDRLGFVQSFGAREKGALGEFYDAFGFVVVRDALSTIDCKETLFEIWDWLEGKAGRGGVSAETTVRRGFGETWSASNGWPDHNRRAGLLSDRSWFTRKFLENRQSQVLYDICKTLLGTKELVISHDRAALFRPTRAPNGESTGWETSLNLHFDLNPWSYVASKDGMRAIDADYAQHESAFLDEHNAAWSDKVVQGLFNLIDNLEEDGGFVCVPGMHRFLNAWAAHSREALASQFVGNETHCTIYREWSGKLLQDEPTGIHEWIQHVSARAGSLILWNPLLAHGSSPNRSKRLRAAQFIKAAPASAWTSRSFELRAKELRRRVPPGTARGRQGARMLGLLPWPSGAA